MNVPPNQGSHDPKRRDRPVGGQENEINANESQLYHKQRTAEPNRAEADRFLTLLDEEAGDFTFQTVDDNKERKDKDKELVNVLNGSLDKHWTTLVDLNARGAGIFVTINKTDLKGRKKENIVQVRALWQEADRGDEPKLPFEPHIVVQSSSGKYHRYILVKDAPLDEFDLVQQRLVDDYGSDPSAKDISRVLRLPGFDHMKNPAKPHRVRILDDSGHIGIAIQSVLSPAQDTGNRTFCSPKHRSSCRQVSTPQVRSERLFM